MDFVLELGGYCATSYFQVFTSNHCHPCVLGVLIEGECANNWSCLVNNYAMIACYASYERAHDNFYKSCKFQVM